MSAIFDEVIIQYDNKSVSLKPTFEMINKIEMPRVSGGLGISLAGLTARISRGDVPVSEIARVVAYMLRSAGEEVSDEDVYVDLMVRDGALQTIEMVSTVFFPAIKKTIGKQADTDKKK